MSVKISELPILDSLADNDVIAGVDTSANVTSKIEMATLKNYIDTNTQYTAGKNINITDNVISAPFVYDKTQTNGLIENLIDETNAQIEELQSEIDSLSTIFNAFPTESGEGESLTLDDTAEVKFKKVDLKGNTSQTQYTGTNILDVEHSTVESLSGITSIIKGNNFINGTTSATEWAGLQLVLTLEAGTYYYKHYTECTDTANSNGLGTFRINKDTQSGTVIINQNVTTNVLNRINSATFTITEAGTYVFVYRFGNATAKARNIIIKDIILSKTDVTYEPYVGGTASPNPSYPQPVNVVSGDNKIVVCGKNLLDLTGITARTVAAGITITPNFNGDLLQNIKISGTPTTTTWQSIKNFALEAGTYILSGINVTQTNKTGLRIGLYIDNARQWFITSNSPTYTFTLDETTTCQFVIWVQSAADYPTGDIYLTPMIRVSSETNDTYEPYQPNTYNIDLPVENLWGGFSNSFTRTDLGVQFTANQDGTITANGTSTNVATSILLSEATSNGIYKTLQKGTYTVSGGGAKYSVEVYDKNNVIKLGGIAVNESKVSFTINEETQIVLRIQVASGVTINETIKLQLEKSSKANSYTPYGTTPIELCKIGNYQDYFYKDSGKWYLHKEIGKITDISNYPSDVAGQWSGGFDTNNYVGFYYHNTGIKSTPVRNDVLSNMFTPQSNSTWNGINGGIQSFAGAAELAISVLKADVESYAGSALNVNNYVNYTKDYINSLTPLIYIILATPTNEEITYQPLIDQLNLLEKAMSKDEQTNISQVNNDKPFILDVTAIKSLQSVLDRIELLES